MKQTDCAVCAWRANCVLKFKSGTDLLNCREFSLDLSLYQSEDSSEIEEWIDQKKN